MKPIFVKKGFKVAALVLVDGNNIDNAVVHYLRNEDVDELSNLCLKNLDDF